MRKLYTTKLINRPEMKFYLVPDDAFPSTTKIYPRGNPKWRRQSGLSYIIQNSFPFVSFDKEGIINFFIKTKLPWFSNVYNDRQKISLFTHIYFQPFLLNQKQKWYMFKTHHIIHPYSMIISNVMPSYPNVTLFLCYISEHWTTARTLNMTINNKIP